MVAATLRAEEIRSRRGQTHEPRRREPRPRAEAPEGETAPETLRETDCGGMNTLESAKHPGRRAAAFRGLYRG